MASKKNQTTGKRNGGTTKKSDVKSTPRGMKRRAANARASSPKPARTHQTKAASTNRSTNAYAYSDRVPIMADVLRVDFDGEATISELFGVLDTRGDGEFDTERRVAATARFDKRVNGDLSVFVRNGAKLALRSKCVVKSHQSARADFRKSHKSDGKKSRKSGASK